jgi:protein involved in polysaccharide export with SLBB domain
LTYRIGAGDILDVRMTGSMSREPTLYTVLSTGVIDYPLAGDPLRVAGLTPEETAARLAEAIRRRGLYDRAQFQVTVREYVSHTAMVSGMVDQPGQKVLRREAVPLYVVLAEASPRPDAGRVVVISRATGQTKTLDLSDPNALNELVMSGDVINVQPRPREFFYIGGTIGSAGQKDFTPGMTLTQAILASGGVTREAGSKVRVAVARQGADGRLVTTEYDLREIEAGRVPDPRVQPGDRIEVGRRR